MPTLAHISDLHLKSGEADRQARVLPVIEAVNAARPDLVVISGDITDDGWDSIDELKWAWLWLDERLAGDWFALPGNHDVGDFACLDKPSGVTRARVQQWNEVYGNAISTQLGGWLVLALNSMLHGSGLGAESQQLERLDRRIADARDKGLHVAAFVHSPLFVQSIDEPTDPDSAYWLGPAGPRQALHLALEQADTRLVGSGHVHQTRLTEADGCTLAWAPPASGTWVHAPGLPNPPCPEQTGFFLHTLGEDGSVRSELVECAPVVKMYEHKP